MMSSSIVTNTNTATSPSCSRESPKREVERQTAGMVRNKQGYLAHFLFPLVAIMDIGDGSAIGEAIQLSL